MTTAPTASVISVLWETFRYFVVAEHGVRTESAWPKHRAALLMQDQQLVLHGGLLVM